MCMGVSDGGQRAAPPRILKEGKKGKKGEKKKKKKKKGKIYKNGKAPPKSKHFYNKFAPPPSLISEYAPEHVPSADQNQAQVL